MIMKAVFFSRLVRGGVKQILQSDCFREPGGIFSPCPLKARGIVLLIYFL